MKSSFDMYYGATPETQEKAKNLRKRETKAEMLLCNRLKSKRFMGLKFRRQHPIDIFIADFYCHEAKLVIELDGEIHIKQTEYDEGRDAEMRIFDLKIIRLQNQEIENNIEFSLDKIRKVIEGQKSPSQGDLGGH